MVLLYALIVSKTVKVYVLIKTTILQKTETNQIKMNIKGETIR